MAYRRRGRKSFGRGRRFKKRGRGYRIARGGIRL